MCLLTFIPAGVQPNLTNLATGAENNADGHGYAIVADGRIIVGRGLDDDDVIERFAAARRMNPQGPALFHSRIATAGRVNIANCHPFYVGDDSQTVLAHNGILPAKAQPYLWDTKRSDTRILAEVLLPKGRVSTIRSRRGRQRICNWMGGSNKIVVLTVNPAYSKSAYLLNPGRGIWDEGIWYSNDSYKEPWWTHYTAKRGRVIYEKNDEGVWTPIWLDDDETGATYSPLDDQAWRWDDEQRGTILGYPSDAGKIANTVLTNRANQVMVDPGQCQFCRAKNALHPVTGMCDCCLTCNDCGASKDECQCYVPESAWDATAEAAWADARAATREQLQLTVAPEREPEQ
jgi:glutamine amidotransferase